MLLVLMIGFLIKIGMVVSYTTSRMVPVDKKRRLADVERTKSDTERKRARLADAEKLVDAKELIVIYYKYQYKYK